MAATAPPQLAPAKTSSAKAEDDAARRRPAAEPPKPAAGLLPSNPSAIPSDPAPPPPRGNGGLKTSSAPLLPLQRKLAIGRSNDPLETEADAAAASVTGERRRRAPRIRLSTPALTEAPPEVHRVLRSPGHALDEDTRSWAESSFNAGFGSVRLHSGPQAEESARAVHARAYTVGSDIVLGPGAPASGPAYRSLLAHELAHVVQQGSAQAGYGPRAASGLHIVGRTGPVVQRDNDDAPPADLGWFTEKVVDGLSAPALVMGDTVHGLVHSTWHGFVAEIKAGAGDAADKVWGRVKEFVTSPSELAHFFPKYWWGLLKGIVSPITGLFDLAMFAIKLEEIAEQVAISAWENRDKLAADAKSLAVTMRAMGTNAKKALGGMLSSPLQTIKDLGPLFDKAKKEANSAAERGGHTMGSMLLEATDKPIPDLAEVAGEVIGTVVVNIALFVFTDGIGDAIVQLGKGLGEVAAMLSKLGEGAELLGGVVAKLGTLFTKVGAWVVRAEEFIAEVASVVLKPLEPVLEQFGEAMSGLKAFLQDLFGVAKKGAAEELPAAVGKGLGAATHEPVPPKLPPHGEPHPAPHATQPHAPDVHPQPHVEPHQPAGHPPEVKQPQLHDSAAHPQEHHPEEHQPAPGEHHEKPAAHSDQPPSEKPPKTKQPKPKAEAKPKETKAKGPQAKKSEPKPAPKKPAKSAPAAKAKAPAKPRTSRIGSGPEPTMETGKGVVPEPRTARSGGIGKIKERRDVFGVKNTEIEGELKPGLKRKTQAPNFNREWDRAELADDVAASWVRRKGMDPKAAKAAAKAFSENYEAAHLWGPGFGDEAAAGMMWAPRDVNQMMQNRFAEKFARDLQREAAAQGGLVKMTATAVPYDSATLAANGLPKNAQFLNHAEYDITIELPHRPPRSVKVTVTADLPGPKASGGLEFDPPGIADRFMDLFR